MILQSLVEYYDRITEESESTAIPAGFQKKEIPFVIVLNPNGTFVGINDTREVEGKRKIARLFVVPQEVKGKTGRKILSNLLWENTEYAIGELSERKKKGLLKKGGNKKVEEEQERIKGKMFPAFAERIEKLAQICDDEGLNAMITFLKNYRPRLQQDPAWEDMKQGGNISFCIAGENRLICQRPAVMEVIAKMESASEKDDVTGICLVSGDIGPIARLHTMFSIGKSRANIVSFNEEAYESYGKKQSFNAPIGKIAEFKYKTAFEKLLEKNSAQYIQVGDATTVFWAEKEHLLETGFAGIFDSSEDFKEGSEYENQAVARYIETLLRSPETGYLPSKEDDTRFYVLGLSPNKSRLAIRFWYEGTVSEVEQHIADHFKDIRIVHGPKDRDFPSIYQLLKSLAFKGDIGKHLPPNLAGEWMRTILMGLPYPRTLLMTALRRNSAEQYVSYQRAAIIKGFLNRFNRFYKPDEQEVTVSLDESNLNIGYRLGRLFAVLERVQEQANPGINTTIRDRFYGTASTTPVATFPILIKLSKHHLSKLGKTNKGSEVNSEKLLGAIMQDVNSLPPHLSLGDQGQFAIGYYHQRQNFFKKKDANNNKEEEEK